VWETSSYGFSSYLARAIAASEEDLCEYARGVDLDRFVSMSIGGDGLKAVVTLAERKPPPVTLGLKEAQIVDAVRDLANAKGVVEPVDVESVAAAVRRWLRDGRRFEVVAAKGRAAVPGTSAKVTLLRPKLVEAPGRAVGRVDKRNLGFVSNVESGTILATATRATAGIAGATVNGVAIPATDGKPATIAVGGGVRAEEGEDLVTYRAALTGIVVELSETRIDVGTAIEIKRDVDHATGNIDAWGSVIVHGSIEEGFSVRARGDVTVDGTCESAFIESGGDVHVGGGILGRSGVTIVKARGRVTARFIENAKVESGRDVTVKDSVLNSQVLAAGAIEVSGRGTVLASRLAGGRTISASTYGSEARLPVELIVGADPIAWRTLHRLHRTLRFLSRSAQKGAQARHRGVSSRSAKAADDRRCKQRLTSDQARHRVARRERALRSVLLDGGGPSVIVRKVAHPKTTVRLGPHVYEVREELHGGVLRIDVAGGQITWIGGETVTARKGEGT
jgi:uncharacterized protein